jgi:hypothetical protein
MAISLIGAFSGNGLPRLDRGRNAIFGPDMRQRQNDRGVSVSGPM